MSAKPANYRARRQWQLDVRARGEVPECGREACHNLADPAWINHHTPLLYCAECAALINRHNPGFCYPESSAEIAMYVPTIADGFGNDRTIPAPPPMPALSITAGPDEIVPTVGIYRPALYRPTKLAFDAPVPTPPTDPKLNRAQRRARGDYQRADCTVRRVR